MADAPGNWMKPNLSLARELEMEAARRQVRHLSQAQLQAHYDSALVHLVTIDNLLRQAMRRIAELELREAVRQAPSPRSRWSEALGSLGMRQQTTRRTRAEEQELREPS